MRSLCWLGCLALVAACGGSKVVRRPGAEWVEAIRIEGNVAIETDTLVDGLVLHREDESNRAVDPYQLNLDTERIKGAYQQLGFFAVKVVARVDHAGLAQTVVFKVTEGRRATTRVTITGLPADISAEKIRAMVALPDGAPFDYGIYDDAKQPMLALLEDAGYAHAQLDAAVLADPANSIATLRFAFDPGPHSTFGAVDIVGIDGPLAAAIRRRLEFHEGDVYSATALVKTQKAINELGRFSSVRVEPTGDATVAVIPVRIVVSMDPKRYEGKLGGGFGYEPLTLEVRGRGSITGAGIPCALCTAGADFRPAYTLDHSFQNPLPKLKLNIPVTRLDLFDLTRVTGLVEVGLDYLTVEAYTSIGEHLRLGLSSPLGVPWLTGRIGWLIEELQYTGIAAPIAADPTIAHGLGLDRNDRLGVYQAELAVEKRDDPLEPHNGFYLDFKANWGTRAAGSNLDYIQLTPDVRGYIGTDRFVLALRARVGAIFDGEVPVTERYYGGGASSDRGFSERRLSPTVGGLSVDGMTYPFFQVGGAGLIEAGVELRGFIGKFKKLPIGGVVFYDLADVTDSVSELRNDVDPRKLHQSVGAGLRIEIIKSVSARFDIGYRLNRYEAGEPEAGSSLYNRLGFHLGIGEAY